MKKALFLMGLGAGAMYLFDPELGTRRREQLRDTMLGLIVRADNTISDTAFDLSDKAHDLAAQASSKVQDVASTVEEKTDTVKEAATSLQDAAKDAVSTVKDKVAGQNGAGSDSQSGQGNKSEKTASTAGKSA